MEAEFNINIIGDHTPRPSPADHVDRSHFGESTMCAMRSRLTIPQERLDPGLVSLRSSIGEAPKYSLSSRQPPLKKFVPPGPNYVPPAFGTGAVKVGFTRARPSKRKIPSPGPADYTLTPRSVHAFGENTAQTAVREGGPRKLWDLVESPGPAVYKPDHLRTRKSSPRWSIGRKLNGRKREPTGEYVKQQSTLSGFKYSMPHSGRPAIMH